MLVELQDGRSLQPLDRLGSLGDDDGVLLYTIKLITMVAQLSVKLLKRCSLQGLALEEGVIIESYLQGLVELPSEVLHASQRVWLQQLGHEVVRCLEVVG